MSDDVRTSQRDRRAIIEILELVNLTHDLRELGVRLVDHIREWTGCEAAALRLRRGEDFPFFATAGFPRHLVDSENNLCSFDEHGEIIRDPQGKPVLECLCGCVLCNTMADVWPWLTDHGSFCVGSSNKFLFDHSDNLPHNLRGKCIDEGYESILIVALRLDDEPYGLLHLCDSRPNVFDDSTIAILERLADTLAVALAHREAEWDLRRQQASLRALASKLTMTEEQERRRIAQVLHDDLCQTLGFAKMKLGSVCNDELPDSARAAVSEVRELLSEAIDFTRDLTVELSPPVLQQSGLAAALAWLTDQMADRYGLLAECRCHEDCFTDPEIDAIVFRSVRELLMNVVKHANATTVRVWTECNDGIAHICISDDGVGFDVGQARLSEEPGGFGLFSIRESLTHLGGNLEVQSSPGNGTTCTLNVPLG